MKILIYSINYLPELTGIGKYTGEMAEWLASRGHEVRMVTAPPYYPQWQVWAGYSKYFYATENINGVKIWRCPIFVPSRPSGLSRILHLASFAFSSSFIMIRQVFWKPDVMIVIEPPFFCAPLTLFLSKITGSCSWLHIQDFEIDAAFDMGILSSNSLRKLVQGFEQMLLKRFDRVSTISDSMIKKLDVKSVSKIRQVLFMNWVDTSVIFPFDKASSYRSILNIPDGNIVALYSGNMGEKQGLEIIIDVSSKLSQHAEITFVLCGDGAARQRLEKSAHSAGNIIWMSLQPMDRLNELLNLSDIHLLPQRADAEDLVMPSKLTGMLASGRPVLATAREKTQIAKVVENCGIVVPPGDADAFSKALVNLAESPEQRAHLGKNARQYALEHLGKESVLTAFEHELITCLSTGQ